VTPKSGLLEGGTALTVKGTNLGYRRDQVTAVTVVDVPCRVVDYTVSTRWHALITCWFVRAYCAWTVPVWRLRGKIIRIVLCCVVYDSCTQWYAHTHMWTDLTLLYVKFTFVGKREVKKRCSRTRQQTHRLTHRQTDRATPSLAISRCR